MGNIVPQFKEGADEKGIVKGQELQGQEYRRTPMNAIVLWERNNGDLEVITGRHRLELAKRIGEETIPAQIVKESEGFDRQKALTFDAHQNILDNQGTEKDYVNYFRNTSIPEEQARLDGILRGTKASSAWVLGKDATDSTFNAYARTGDLKFQQAVAIAKAAPGNEQLQNAGQSFVLKNPRSSALEIDNYVKSISQFEATKKSEQTDMFGYDDSSIRAAEEQSKKVTAIQNGLERDSRTINSAIKGEGKLELTDEAAKQYGITDRSDKSQLIAARQKVLEQMSRWDKWYVDPELVAQLKGETVKPPKNAPTTEETDKGPVMYARAPEVTGAQDAAYLKAVKDGDMETAQKMVDEAAKKAGYTIEAYHAGTVEDTFSREFSGSGLVGVRSGHIFFAGNKDAADYYAEPESGRTTRRYYLRSDNLREFDGGSPRDNADKANIEAFQNEKDYSGTVTRGVVDGDRETDVFTLPYNEDGTTTQAKLADPVTRDDKGNVIPLSQRFNEDAPDIRYSLAPKTDLAPFYSQLERVAAQKMGGKMPVEQLRRMLKSNSVTDAEIENLIGGLEGTVTKQQVLDEIKANGVEFRDVVLGGPVISVLAKPVFQGGEWIYRIEDDDGNLLQMAYDSTEAEKLRRKYLRPLEKAAAPPTHFSRYTEPGAVPGSYREMFVTVPAIKVAEHVDEREVVKVWFGDDLKRFSNRERAIEYIQNAKNIDHSKAVDFYEDHVNIGKEEFSSVAWQDGHAQYSDIHNPVVRIRFNEREADGKRILFVEEMQGPTDADQQKMPAWLSRRIYDIGVKRVLAYAKENGFDGVAWTTGDMQAKRYDLSKQVEHVGIFRSDDGTYNIYVTEKGAILDREIAGDISAGKLEDYIGKELAGKIIDNPNPHQGYSGLDLKVGGEGLKRRYDQTITSLFKKYGKELVGETKIEIRNIGGGRLPSGAFGSYRDVPFVPITDKTPASYPKYSQGSQRTSRGMATDRIQKIVDKATGFLKSAPKINVVRHTSEVPIGVLDDMEKNGILDENGDSDVQGFAWNGKIWLIGDNLQSPKEAVYVLTHELMHDGLGRFLDSEQRNVAIKSIRSDYGNLMNAIYKAHYKEIREIAKTTHTHLDLSTVKGCRQAAEEWLCNQAYESQLKWYDRLVAIFHDLLRAMGIDVKLSDAEVRTVLRDAFDMFGKDLNYQRESGNYAYMTSKKGTADRIPPKTTPEAGGRTIRTHPIPESVGKIITSYWKNDKVKAHQDYTAAKSGDREAAARLVVDMVKPETIAEAKQRFGPDVIYAAPHAIEASGKNAIPAVLAHYYASTTGAKVDENIVQANRPYHTGAKAMERMISRVAFDGDVVKDGEYVLVDDTATLGGTIAEMAHHIRGNGGRVVGVITLTNASRGRNIAPEKAVTDEIERRYGNEVRELFGVDPKALTAAEAGYLVGFRDADSLRNRAVKAGEERNQRLLSKGVRTSETAKVTKPPQYSIAQIGRTIDGYKDKLAKTIDKVEAVKTAGDAFSNVYEGAKRAWFIPTPVGNA